MSQADVYRFLGKSKRKWFLANQIAKKLKVGTGSVNANLSRLFKRDEVKKKVKRNDARTYMWKWKK